MIRQDQRTHLGSLLAWEVSMRKRIGYKEQRPEADIYLYESEFDKDIRANAVPPMDCSSFDMMNFHFCGFKDPSGNNFNGFGNSAAFYKNLEHFADPLATKLGTLVVFGPGGATHSAVVYEGGIEDPMLCSHGDPSGPAFLSLSELSSLGEHTFLSIGSL